MSVPVSGTDDDRLSELSDDVLIHILSFVPDTKSTAKTSLLSSRYCHLWAHVPSIHLRPSFRYPLNQDVDRYTASVNACLSTHRSPTLQTLSLHLVAGPHHEPWIKFAADRSVQTLRLCRYGGKVPRNLGICRTLTSLHLNFDIDIDSVPPTNYTSPAFPLLQSLSIWDARSPKALTLLLSHCPSLRSLALTSFRSTGRFCIEHDTVSHVTIRCGDNQNLRLNTPSLASVTYSGRIDLYFRVDNAPNLVDADIDLDEQITNFGFDSLRDAQKSQICAMIKEVSHVSGRLKVTNWFFHSVPYWSPNIIFNNLKQLQCRINGVTSFFLSSLIAVLGNCPKLELLHVCIKGELKEGPPESKKSKRWGQSKATKEFTGVRPNLKVAMLENFMGTSNEMMIIKYLLSTATSLERLVIGDSLMPDKKKIEKLLADIPVASPHIRICKM